MRHIAFIPARKGSKGFPHKNRLFFKATAEFIDAVPWFDRRIVSTDDEVVAGYAADQGYELHERPAPLAGDAVSIHAVFDHAVAAMAVRPDDVLWLFYLPLLYKDRRDFEAAREIVEQGAARSLCGFVPARTHPYNCWRYEDGKGLSQYIPNDAFRRQDLPAAWMHHHYVCCFVADVLPSLNSELINTTTYPYFLSPETSRRLIEIDTPEDWARWQQLLAQEAQAGCK